MKVRVEFFMFDIHVFKVNCSLELRNYGRKKSFKQIFSFMIKIMAS